MALVDRRWQRTATLCALYVAQGIPWGFMTIAIVAYLTQQGVSAKTAGDLAAVVLVPWSFKLIWGPIIDSVTFRSMGRRRAWIIGAELLMALTLLGMLFLGDLTQELRLLGWMFFLHNCFASLQDVCTDALAVDVLPFEEQPSANGLMWGSKLVGKGGGAAVLAWVMANWGFEAAVWVQFFMLIGIMLFPLLILERPGEKRLPWSDGAADVVESAENVRNPLLVVKDLLKGFSLSTTFIFLIYTVLKHVGTGVNEIITKDLYTKQLGWTYVEVSEVAGFWAIFPNLAGALLCGFLANRWGRRTMLVIGLGGFGLCAIGFALCGLYTDLWHYRWLTISYLLVSEGLVAIGSVAFLSMAMRITWTQSAATMFTTYMTISNVGHVLGNWLAGRVLESLGYHGTFVFAAAASILPLFLLMGVEPMKVDVHKFAESEAEAASEGEPALVDTIAD